jgi:hypothetical protein
MTIDISKQIEEIATEIVKLETKKRDLERLLIESAESFRDKFKVWARSDLDTRIDDYIPDKNKFPLLRSKIDSDWVSRHETFHILERFEDEMYWMLDADDEEIKEALSNERTKKDIEFAEALAKEIYEGKLKSFIFDW